MTIGPLVFKVFNPKHITSARKNNIRENGIKKQKY